MDIFPIQADIVFACALAAAFALGLIVHRLFTSWREHQLIEQLNDKVARLEMKGDAAHRVTLDLAARHNQLIGEHHEAEWLIRSLKSKLEPSDSRLVKVSEDSESQAPAMNEEFWSAAMNPAAEHIN